MFHAFHFFLPPPNSKLNCSSKALSAEDSSSLQHAVSLKFSTDFLPGEITESQVGGILFLPQSRCDFEGGSSPSLLGSEADMHPA